MTDILIPWNTKKISNPGWNELCANVVERFGLPGDMLLRYVPTGCVFHLKMNKTDLCVKYF